MSVPVMNIQKRIILQIGLLPLWILPLLALTIVQSILILAIEFGFLTNETHFTITILSHIIVQCAVVAVVSVYIYTLQRVVHPKHSVFFPAIILSWILPLVILGIASLTGNTLPLKWIRLLVFSSPLLVHCYYLFFAK